jgi:hypothetical protein
MGGVMKAITGSSKPNTSAMEEQAAALKKQQAAADEAAKQQKKAAAARLAVGQSGKGRSALMGSTGSSTSSGTKETLG